MSKAYPKETTRTTYEMVREVEQKLNAVKREDKE
jgi:hypothetical protein